MNKGEKGNDRMKQRITTPIQNALIFVLDSESGELPESLDEALVTATSSSLAIGTRPDIDGPVEIVLTDEPCPNDDNTLHLAWSGRIEALNNDVSVCSVNLDRLMFITVNNPDPLIQVWANDDEEPDRLVIVVDSAGLSRRTYGTGETGAQSK